MIWPTPVQAHIQNGDFLLNGVYLCGFVFHTGGVGSMGVPRPLASEVWPCDGVQRRRPPDGTGTPYLQLGPFCCGKE